MTRLEVIDSAIKIGLGAAISAIASWVAITLTARNEAKKEIHRRRLDVLQQAAVDFEKQSTVFLKLGAVYPFQLN